MTDSTAQPPNQLINLGPEDDDSPICGPMRADGAHQGEPARDPDPGGPLGFAQPLDEADRAQLPNNPAWQAVPEAAASPAAAGERSRPKGFNARRMAPLKKRRKAKGGRGHRRRRWRR